MLFVGSIHQCTCPQLLWPPSCISYESLPHWWTGWLNTDKSLKAELFCLLIFFIRIYFESCSASVGNIFVLLLYCPVDTQGKCHLAVYDFSRHTGIWVTSLANSEQPDASLVFSAWRPSKLLAWRMKEHFWSTSAITELLSQMTVSSAWYLRVCFWRGECTDTLLFLTQKRGLNRARIKFIAFHLISNLSVCLFLKLFFF